MSTKMKKYRTKKERQENSNAMKKGVPLEVYQMVKAGDLPADTEVLMLAIGQGEACRDMNDIEAVILERDITGTFIPMRRAGAAIERVIQTVTAFVTPKSDPVYKEEVSEEKPEETAKSGKKGGK